MRFFPENIDATLFTHLLYAFAKVENPSDDVYTIEPYEWNDVLAWDPSKGMYARFDSHVRSQNPSVKTLYSLGVRTHATHTPQLPCLSSLGGGNLSFLHEACVRF